MYELVFHPHYREQQEEIEEDLRRLDAELEGLYAILRRSPYLGHPIRSTGLYAKRHRLFLGLALVTVYYRIDEVNATVTLVAIRPVDPFLM